MISHDSQSTEARSFPNARPAIDAVLGRPLIPAVLALAAGILTARCPWAFGAGLLGILALAARLPAGRIVLGVALGFYCLGAALTTISSSPSESDISRFIGKGYVTVTGSVAGDPELSRFTAAVIMKAREVESADGAATPVDGMFLLRIPIGSAFLEYGESLRVRGSLRPPESTDNPGLFRYPDYLARMGVRAAMNVRRPESVTRISSQAKGGDFLSRWMQKGRESLIRTLDRYLPPLESNLLAGIVLGQRTRLPAEVKDDFAATGTTHILASSGMNVGMVAALFFWLARVVRIRRTRAVIPVIIAMLIYSLLAGAKPSVIRADVMASAMLIAWLVNREPDLPSSIALAAIALLIWNPYSLVDPGFQLSFAAVIALTACMPLFEQHIRVSLGPEGSGQPLLIRLRAGIATGFLVSLVAQLAALPLTAQHFNQISLTGLIANALIVFVIPLLLFGGLALWLVGALMPPAASILSWLMSFPLAYVLGVAEFFGSFPFAVINVVSPGWPLVGACYALATVMVLRLRARAGLENRL